MSLPENRLSVAPVRDEFLFPDNYGFDPKSDWEMGGVALGDTHSGLEVQPWNAWEEGGAIWLKATDGSPAIRVLTAANARHVALSFDRNMNVVLSWESSGTVSLYWYDTLINRYVTTTFPDIRNPRLCHDDKRKEASSWSDVLFFYIKGGDLCMRRQRDRYGTEFVLASGLEDYQLQRVGMARNLRIRFDLR